MRYVVRCIALLVCLAASCSDGSVLPERVGIENVRASAELADEAQRLRRERPVSISVGICVVHAGCAGWFEPQPSTQIIILDKGREMNVRTLRHEWCHAMQYEAKRPMSEDEAKAAEENRWPDWVKKADGK
jgi:hypothetical protein